MLQLSFDICYLFAHAIRFDIIQSVVDNFQLLAASIKDDSRMLRWVRLPCIFTIVPGYRLAPCWMRVALQYHAIGSHQNHWSIVRQLRKGPEFLACGWLDYPRIFGV